MFSAPEASVPTQSVDDANLWEGWLEKKGARMLDGWLRRFFILTPLEVCFSHRFIPSYPRRSPCNDLTFRVDSSSIGIRPKKCITATCELNICEQMGSPHLLPLIIGYIQSHALCT